MNFQNVFQCSYSLPGDCRKGLAWWRFITLWRVILIATCKLGRPDISMYISLGFRNVMTSSSRRKLGRHCFYRFFGRFGDRQILLEINFDCKSTYSSLRSSEGQSAQKGSHGLVETGDKNRNVTDNMQGRQKNVPKKNAIRGKFVVLLIKPSYYSCFDVLVAVVVLVAKAPRFIDVCKLLGIRMCF